MNIIKAQLQKELKQAGWHSRGYLPHFDRVDVPQTITFRLADSLPHAVIERWKKELAGGSTENPNSVLGRRIESYVDQGYGGCALRDARVANMVQESLFHFDSERYWLSAWVIMPNHVHLLLTPQVGWSLSRIMKDIKSFTSREANQILGRRGQFWMEDYFDRYVRDANHFASATNYIENNPVKAKLCARPEDWEFSSARFRAQE